MCFLFALLFLCYLNVRITRQDVSILFYLPFPVAIVAYGSVEMVTYGRVDLLVIVKAASLQHSLSLTCSNPIPCEKGLVAGTVYLVDFLFQPP